MTLAKTEATNKLDVFTKRMKPLLDDCIGFACENWNSTRVNENFALPVIRSSYWRDLQEAEELERLIVPIHDDELSSEEVEAKTLHDQMNRMLQLWLCYYFSGLPRPDLSAQFGTLGSLLGAYPDGAMYFKLAGDAYRCERRYWEKVIRKRSNKVQGGITAQESGIVFENIWKENTSVGEQAWWQGTDQKSGKGLLVVAYSPLLMLSVLAPTDCSKRSENVEASIEHLAAAYERIQMFRYLKLGLPVRYAVSQESFCSYAASEVVTAHAEGRDYDTFVHQKREVIDGLFEQHFQKIAQYINQFLPAELVAWQQIHVFPENAIRRRGMTSMTLGQDDGIISNRPNRLYDQNRSVSYWEERPLLVQNRKKVLRMWHENPAQPPESATKDESKIPFVFSGTGFIVDGSNRKIYHKIDAASTSDSDSYHSYLIPREAEAYIRTVLDKSAESEPLHHIPVEN